MTNMAFFTICSANYLAYARTLHHSLLGAYGKSLKFYVFLMDEIGERFNPTQFSFTIIEARELNCPNFYDMAARYSIMEMNTAIKPFCFQYIFGMGTDDQVIYLDPDIFVLSKFVELEKVLASETTSIVLTPHSTAPLMDGKNPDDKQLLRAGAYNLGFCAMRKSASADAMLTWWGNHLTRDCLVAVERGIFVDQKFCDLVPSYFDNVVIFRHAGYNVAYWNLLGRKVVQQTAEHGVWTASDQPLRFFHFSGVIKDKPDVFSKHQDRFSVEEIGDARVLLQNYLRLLNLFNKMGEIKFDQLGYAYGKLKSGVPLTDDMRLVYQDACPPAPRSEAESFSGDLTRFALAAPGFGKARDNGLPRLMHRIWAGRADLRATFDLSTSDGCERYASWFFDQQADHHTPIDVLDALKDAMTPSPSRSSVQGIARRNFDDVGPRADAMRWTTQKQLTDDPRRLAIYGRFRAATGVGAAARASYRAALAAELEPAAHDLDGYEPQVELDFSLRYGVEDHDVALFHINADETVDLRCHAPAKAVRAPHRIGYWAWELEDFPLEWSAAFDFVDEVWCPSRFVAQAVQNRTSKPVFVIPHAVDAPSTPLDMAAARQRLGLPQGATIFLTGYDAASFTERKNPAGAVAAFKAAFPQETPTNIQPLLLIKIGNAVADLRGMQQLRAMIGSDDRIHILEAKFSPNEISTLQSACDVFVSLHRSEGFGLWIAESMARGKPVVVTNYGGNLDFTDDPSAFRIGYRLIDIQEGQYPFGVGRRWADPDFEEASVVLRRLAQDPALRRRMGEAGARMIQQQFSLGAIGAKIRRRLFQLRAESFDLPSLRIG